MNIIKFGLPGCLVLASLLPMVVPDAGVAAEKKVLVTGTMKEMLTVDHPWVHEYFHGPRARAAQDVAEGAQA